ncbi:MAG: hypothetical protein OEZ59_01625 [Deltaproteobacteria bacterium]|nr:hypothetical protein [Deltaproteobacteria bacterium]
MGKTIKTVILIVAMSMLAALAAGCAPGDDGGAANDQKSGSACVVGSSTVGSCTVL